MTRKELRELLGPTFQPPATDLAWLRLAVNAETKRLGHSVGREEAINLYQQLLDTRGNPQEARKLVERGLPAVDAGEKGLAKGERIAEAFEDLDEMKLEMPKLREVDPQLKEMLRELKERPMPDFAAMRSGTASSVPETTPLDSCKQAYARLNQQEREQFLRWMIDRGSEQKPAGRRKRKSKGQDESGKPKGI